MTNSGENENNHKNSMELTRREGYEIYNGNRDERRNDWFTTRKPNRAGRRGAARCMKNWRWPRNGPYLLAPLDIRRTRIYAQQPTRKK